MYVGPLVSGGVYLLPVVLRCVLEALGACRIGSTTHHTTKLNRYGMSGSEYES